MSKHALIYYCSNGYLYIRFISFSDRIMKSLLEESFSTILSYSVRCDSDIKEGYVILKKFSKEEAWSKKNKCLFIKEFLENGTANKATIIKKIKRPTYDTILSAIDSHLLAIGE